VEYQQESIGDLVSGKGAGCVFCLHGPPGTGKTLTAESISEFLHRPLYSVSVGELGTSPIELETRLRQILEVASIWEAVILIDEADIFLEARNVSDINRNALVSIFLRLLEYHDGVLFLTTNRVKTFDEAFHSRISMSIFYEDLGMEGKKKVWKNFTKMAKMDDESLDYDRLASFPLNGRQIRTTVRLAQCIAKTEGCEKLTMSHLERTIKVSQQFSDMTHLKSDE